MSREIATSKTQVLFARDLLVLQKLGRGNELIPLRSAVETADHFIAYEIYSVIKIELSLTAWLTSGISAGWLFFVYHARK